MGVVVMIVWYHRFIHHTASAYLHISCELSLIRTHGEMFVKQVYMINFVSDTTNKTECHNITEILLKLVITLDESGFF